MSRDIVTYKGQNRDLVIFRCKYLETVWLGTNYTLIGNGLQ